MSALEAYVEKLRNINAYRSTQIKHRIQYINTLIVQKQYDRALREIDYLHERINVFEKAILEICREIRKQLEKKREQITRLRCV